MPEQRNDDLTMPKQGETVGYDEEPSDVEDTEDGGAIIRTGGEDDNKVKAAHFANIVDEVDQAELKSYVATCSTRSARTRKRVRSATSCTRKGCVAPASVMMLLVGHNSRVPTRSFTRCSWKPA